MKSAEVAEVLKDIFSIEARMEQVNLWREKAVNAQKYLDEGWNITTELISMAHTRRDTILACTFCGKTIDCDKYFNRTLTDVGVCHTFYADVQHNGHRTLKVQSPGSDCSLQLIINVQIKEYFFGEGDASGIRVFYSFSYFRFQFYLQFKILALHTQ